MQRIATGSPPIIFGDGSQTMDFVFTSDIARANLAAAASEVKQGAYNIASERETSLRELAQALLRTMGSDASIEYGPERAVNGVTRRLASTAAAQRDLGWQAEVPLAEGLHQLVAWWREARLSDAELAGSAP